MSRDMLSVYLFSILVTYWAL